VTCKASDGQVVLLVSDRVRGDLDAVGALEFLSVVSTPSYPSRGADNFTADAPLWKRRQRLPVRGHSKGGQHARR